MDRYPPATEFTPRMESIPELAALLAEWAVVNASMDVHLLDADFPLNPEMAWADLSEASYAGYAAKAVTLASFTLQQYETGGRIRQQSTTLASWSGPAGGGGPTIYGYALTETGGHTRVYRVFKFATPVALTDNHTVLDVIVVVQQPAGSQT